MISPISSANTKTKDKAGPVVLVSKEIAFTFPLSYAYLAGYLREKGEEVRVLFKDLRYKELVKQIMELNPVLVGFGSLYPELKETGKIIKLLDQAGRRFPVVIGGQMVSPVPEFAVKITGADFGVIGEGEIVLHQLVTALRDGRDTSGIKGLVIRQGSEVFCTGQGDFIKDLSKLPAIAYDLFPQERWLPIGLWYAEHCPQPHWRVEDRVINVHGGRGCPFKCNFCYHHSKARYRSIPLMMAEAAEALDRFKGNMLYFSDDLVLATPERARQLVEAIRALNRPIQYSISSRFDILDRIDDELLGEMRETGCRIMGLGVESGSDRILKIIGKNCTAETILNGLERLKKFGILPTASIMVGQYTETKEDVEASIKLMRESVRSNPNINYAFTITTPFPGSPLYDLIFRKGYLRDHQEFYDRYFSAPGEFKQVVNLSEMTDEEVLEMRRKIEKIYREEKPKVLSRKTVVSLKTDGDLFREQYRVPFYVDKIMLDSSRDIAIRCVSPVPSSVENRKNSRDRKNSGEEFEQSDYATFVEGQVLIDLVAMAVKAFPDISNKYDNQAEFCLSPFSRPNFPHLYQDGGKLFRWFVIRERELSVNGN